MRVEPFFRASGALCSKFTLTSGKLHSHLADTEEQAQQLFLRLVNEYAANEGITEQLKATDPMAWLQRMNNIRERVTEMVNAEVVFV